MTLPIVSRLMVPLSTWPSGNRRVLDPESLSCLQDSTASVPAAPLCRSGASMSPETHHQKHETCSLSTVAPRHSSEVGVPVCYTETESSPPQIHLKSRFEEDAQIWGPAALTGGFLRSPGAFCTLLMKCKIRSKRAARLCHSEPPSRDPEPRTDTPEVHLTHTDAQGRAAMVDVGGKYPSRRAATASATVILGPAAFRLLQDNQLAKGDALAVAQLAGIMGSKQTSALIPLCHPLPLDHAAVTFELDQPQMAVVVTATCRTTSKTGVEMEALTAATVAALTIYDMCKAVSHDIIITDVKLVSKSGGKRDFHRHQPTSRTQED
ncbi:molybdenum cofactor biosynthesis protein 1-like [Aulostomus maculatus]